MHAHVDYKRYHDACRYISVVLHKQMFYLGHGRYCPIAITIMFTYIFVSLSSCICAVWEQ